MSRVLIIEDQPKLLRSLQQGLQEAGFDVLTAETGDSGFDLAQSAGVDVIILDWMLPGRDGLQLLKDLRQAKCRCPVLMLTARGDLQDRVSGLNAGADDYVVKPFEFAELLARLQALIRRTAEGRQLVLRVDDLELDLLTRRVVRSGRELDLSRREFELLEFLVRHRGEVVPRETLAREVWKEPLVLTNIIDVYVRMLRKKLDRSGLAPLIRTVRGAGYVLGAPT
jgi:two-component system copper resistance phosphate regulon response regulator CusR